MSNRVVLVYSHRPQVREDIIGAVGRRPAPDVGRVDFLEVDNVADVLAAVDDGVVDVLILDGEAQPTGGMGIARQVHMEAEHIPPIVLTVARAADRWLATWSRADEVLVHPLDPITTADAVARVLRKLPQRLGS